MVNIAPGGRKKSKKSFSVPFQVLKANLGIISIESHQFFLKKILFKRVLILVLLFFSLTFYFPFITSHLDVFFKKRLDLGFSLSDRTYFLERFCF